MVGLNHDIKTKGEKNRNCEKEQDETRNFSSFQMVRRLIFQLAYKVAVAHPYIYIYRQIPIYICIYMYRYTHIYSIYPCMCMCIYIYICMIIHMFFLPWGEARTQTLQDRAHTDSLLSLKLTELECWQTSLEPEETPVRAPYLSDTLHGHFSSISSILWWQPLLLVQIIQNNTDYYLQFLTSLRQKTSLVNPGLPQSIDVEMVVAKKG